MHVGVLGGTGPAGSGLAIRLASVGLEVTIGSRTKDRAQATTEALCAKYPDRTFLLDAGDNKRAASADVVVLATPWDAAAATALTVANQLAGKVVISMANALAKVGDEFQPLIPPRGSVAASIQAVLPASQVAAAFHHLPARELADIDHPVESDVLICSDHMSATETTSEIVRLIPGCRPLDSGKLSNAAPIESFAAVILQLNVRYKTRAAVRLTGINHT
jgi:NADPH-dependent F420 reductase